MSIYVWVTADATALRWVKVGHIIHTVVYTYVHVRMNIGCQLGKRGTKGTKLKGLLLERFRRTVQDCRS